MYIEINDAFRGISIPNSTVSVGGITLAEDHKTMSFSVSYRMDMDSDPYNTEFYGCNYDSKSGDIIKQAYAYLKTLDKFKLAVLMP